MADLYDYLEEYGNFDFKDEPFNDIDNLIFSQLIYTDFGGIVDGFESDGKTALSIASKRFFDKTSEEELENDIAIVQNSANLLKVCAATKRYKTVKIAKYVNNVNEKIDKQFSGANFFLSDGTVLIAFRGTDTSVTGVKESAMLSYMFPVPAQIEALYYFQETAALAKVPVRVCGHSKGGNLAVFAAVNCSNALHKKIIAVYEDDAPGFPKEFIERYDFVEMKDRIISFVPERSIIGCLLNHSEYMHVVKSDNENLKQHQVYSWQVSGNSFEFAESRDDVSLFIDKYLKQLLNDVGPQNVEVLFDTIFDFIVDSGVKNYDDMKKLDAIKLIKALSNISDFSEDEKLLLADTVKLAIKEFSKMYYDTKVKSLFNFDEIKNKIDTKVSQRLPEKTE